MTIPEPHLSDVLDDLATLYLAGEASPGTRAVLEQRAATDPAFRARLDAARSPLPQVPVQLPADHETATLRQTRQFLRLRTLFTATGIAFTLLPFSFGKIGDGGVRFLILGQYPGLVWSFLSIAAASWVACYLMHREVRKAGL